MSCGLALAFVMASASPQAASAPVQLAAVATPAALAHEPLYADIVNRAKGLHSRVKIYQAAGGASVDLAAFRAELDRLAALDMQGHFDLKARNVDGDLKCILKGIAEDLPKRLEDLAAARDAGARTAALKEMGYLLNDNVDDPSPPARTPPPARTCT